MSFQGLLFSEPTVAETGVWCSLSDGINPSDWAKLCRYIGSLSPARFNQIKNELMLKQAGKRNKINNDIAADIPLISIGPSGLGGDFQVEEIV